MPRDFVSVGDGKKASVEEIGNILCSVSINGKPSSVELKDVLYAATLVCNLISVSKCCKAGLTVVSIHMTIIGENASLGLRKVETLHLSALKVMIMAFTRQ